MNFDFIYGRQNNPVSAFVSTINKSDISSRAAWIYFQLYCTSSKPFKRQMILEKAGLRVKTKGLKMFEEFPLQAAGYVPIGMDRCVARRRQVWLLAPFAIVTSKDTALAASRHRYMLLGVGNQPVKMKHAPKHKRHFRICFACQCGTVPIHRML